MIDQFWTFLVAITLLTLFPGVDSLLVVRNASRGGWRDGVATSTGICCGLFVHALVSALGISALLLQSAVAFSALKFIGGGYLVWLGVCSLWQAMKTGGTFGPQLNAVSGSRPLQLKRSLREGFISNVFNPKTLLFYMAFLPQFIDPVRSPLVQSLFMAAIHFAVAMIYQGLLSVLVIRIKGWFQGGFLRRLSSGLVGVLLISFGLRIFLEKRI
ncbi:MAG: LysE family translocator [Desulfuromonadales bacterium]|nr:LysE family translocator [Desulfuromonadales bacterium]MBN2793523.1 LysE family translocator [Desulfuromonadales bacterium]